MADIICPNMTDILKSDECLENFAGLGSYAYAFIKGDLAAPLKRSETDDTNYVWPTTGAFKAGKGLYKFELKNHEQGIKGSSRGKRNGFRQSFEFAFESVNEAISGTARALNNLDLGFIVPDPSIEGKFQIMYDPYYDVEFDNDGIQTDTGKGGDDTRQTTCTATLEPVVHPNFWIAEPESGWDSLLASAIPAPSNP